jgi:DNA-binding transcriptional ArsR family regulator
MSIPGDTRANGEGTLMSHHALLSPRGEEMRVELDKKSLFALASDTRVDILKTLQPMRRTVTQLSEELDIDKAAIHRHLKKMEEGGLVIRYEDHGFVYYGLSWKARDLLSPNENTKIVIMFSLTWALCIGVVFLVILGMTNLSDNYLGPSRSPDEYGSGAQFDMKYNLSTPSHLIPFLISTAAVVIGAISIGFLGFRRLRRPFQKKPNDGPGSSRPDPETVENSA